MILRKVTLPFVGRAMEIQTPNSFKIRGHYRFQASEKVSERDFCVVYDYLNETDRAQLPRGNAVMVAGAPSPIKSCGGYFPADSYTGDESRFWGAPRGQHTRTRRNIWAVEPGGLDDLSRACGRAGPAVVDCNRPKKNALSAQHWVY